MCRIFFLCSFLSAANLNLQAQHSSDTSALIRELNKVMSFAVQPYLCYTTTTTMSRGPLLAGADTGRSLHSHFYKMGTDLFYGNEQDEMFLQDSLLVRIDHGRKSIQLNKVDEAARRKIDLLPLKKVDMQRLFREHYTLSEIPDLGDTASILIRKEDKSGLQPLADMQILIRYVKTSHLPLIMAVTMQLRQAPSQGISDQLKKEGFDVAKMVVERDGRRSLVLKQSMLVSFGAIAEDKADAMKMPSWKQKIAYDQAVQDFKGIGPCEGYEVIKTF